MSSSVLTSDDPGPIPRTVGVESRKVSWDLRVEEDQPANERNAIDARGWARRELGSVVAALIPIEGDV